MGDFTKRKIQDGSPEEQQGPKKPIAVRPFAQRAPGKLVLGATGSPFQVWQKPNPWKGLGVVGETSSSGTKPYLQLLPSSRNAPAQDDNHKINGENSNPDPAKEENPANGGAGKTSGAANDDNTAKTDEAQADPPVLGGNSLPVMDPRRLRRILSNRASAQRSRVKQNEYVAGLERKARYYENKIARLRSKIEELKSQQRLMLIEYHKLRLQIAVGEKERILQEVEFEKNTEEVNKLRELARKEMVEAQARVLNFGVVMQLMSNPNLYPSGMVQIVCTNSYQAENEAETSQMQTGMVQQPENLREMWTANLNNRQRSSLNLNSVKSE